MVASIAGLANEDMRFIQAALANSADVVLQSLHLLFFDFFFFEALLWCFTPVLFAVNDEFRVDEETVAVLCA